MRYTRHVIRAALLAGAACAAGSAVPAMATIQADATAAYDLPAQPLDETLRAIARRSGYEILFEAATVEGRGAPAIRGQLTARQAVGAALAGSGLIVAEKGGAFLVRLPERPGAVPEAAPAPGIMVTGTRIRGGDGPSPVISTSRHALEEAGASNLADFTRLLPQNYTGGVNPGIAGGGQQGGQSNINNSAALNLRGLGPDATLTLLNGHRLAYDALSQGIDIASIPLAAVERIDVVPDGASALYGSDAVAGVANIVLRRDFKGLESTARAGWATEGGDAQQQYSVVTGGRWTSGGVMAALDYSRATAVFADQRDYTRNLDPSFTLSMRTRQLSGVLAGHQKLLAGVELDFDGFYAERHSLKQSPFFANASVTSWGLITHPALHAWAVNPTLRVELPAGWRLSIGGTRGVSRTTLDTQVFIGGKAIPHHLVYENRTSGFDAGVEGAVFRLPGGEARLAAGGGLRSLVLDAHGDIAAFTFRQSRRVLFGYGELSLPLVGPDMHVPLARRLILTGAFRHEKYRGLEGVTTPKLGLIYQPFTDATFRASWGRSFKAPTLFQLNELREGVLLQGSEFDPPTPPLAPNATVLLLGGGSADLRPERATSWSGTLELTPRFLPGFRLEVDYFDVDYRNRIAELDSGALSALANPNLRDLVTRNPGIAQVNAVIATLPIGLENFSGQDFNPSDVSAIIDGALRNRARVHARGVDVQADYRIGLGAGTRLLLTGAATYLKSEQQITASQPPFAQAGTIFNIPHWRGRAGASVQGRSADLGAFVNYVGDTRDTRYPDGRGPGAFVTLDLTAALRPGTSGLLRGFELRLVARNLLDAKPGRIRTQSPEAPTYDSTNQSSEGRFLGLAIRKAW